MSLRTEFSGPLDADKIINETLSPAAFGVRFAEAARGILQEADDVNRRAVGRVPRNVTYVDRKAGAPLESVRPDGVVVRKYDLVPEVLLFIAEELRLLSPIGGGPDKRPGHPGFYKASHVLFADGSEVPFSNQIPEAREYVILSLAPYARRIERRRSLYELVAAKASRRFGNIAKVYFSYRSPLLSYVPGASHRAERKAQKNDFARHAAKRIERASRVPAIIVANY